MRRLAPFGLLAAVILLLAGWPSAPAHAACHPPADGRCHTMSASSLSSLAHACRCVSPRQYGPHAAQPGQKSCRQTCNSRDLVCESNARNFTQRNNCTHRMQTCNSRC